MSAYAGERDLQRDIEGFLYREARLMDEHAYDEWLALWTDELEYWVPCGGVETDPHRDVSLIYDGREHLEDRVWRLKSKQAHAQRPRSSLIRVVSNVEIVDSSPAEVIVSSAFVLAEVRNAVQTIYVGRNVHVLVPGDRGFRMRRKKVVFANNDSPLGNLTFLL